MYTPTECLQWLPINGLEMLISIIGSAGLTILFFLLLKPKLHIESVCYDSANRTIRIKVINNGKWNAMNIRIEACFIDKTTGNTLHMTLDRVDFIILPSKNNIDNSVVFKTRRKFYYINNNIHNKVACVRKGTHVVRVRVHSYHSFSGFGKAEERIFTSI
jgi:hypothetical protein